MEKACRLTNTTYWDIAPSLPLPSLPVHFGSPDPSLRLSDEPPSSAADALAQAGTIAEFLGRCDVSYLKLKEEVEVVECGRSRIYEEVLKHDRTALDLSNPGPFREHQNFSVERKPFENNASIVPEGQAELWGNAGDHFRRNTSNDITTPSSRKPKTKKKGHESISLSTDIDQLDEQDVTASFCELVEDFCGRAEASIGDQGEADGTSTSSSDIKMLINEISSARTKKILQLVPIDTLTRLLAVLDHQIHCGQGLSIDENLDEDAMSLVMSALESTHAALAIMTHQDMPKQLYKEEIIERTIDFSRHQIMDVMAAADPTYRAIHRPSENGYLEGEDDEDYVENDTTARKRNVRSNKVKKPTGTGNRPSATTHALIQKLCLILAFLRDLLSIEKLSDSCILQMVKTCFSTFLAENIQFLQLKAIDLLCGVFSSYAQHRNFLIDETVSLIWKLPSSKKAFRSYHLPDEDQKQIQMVTALFIQLVQSSCDLPEMMKTKLPFNSISDGSSVDENLITKCHKTITDTCCQFWTGIVERIASSKAQDISESKIVIENLVLDLLNTLHLPEFPASAPILEVLTVLLLQNTGLKSKDMTARGATIDLLGTIAAWLKRDAVNCRSDNFWILEEEVSENDGGLRETCVVCHEEKGSNSLLVCHVCQKCFHVECLGAAGQENLTRDWCCHFCSTKKQLNALQLLCKSQRKHNTRKNSGDSTAVDSIACSEIIQQILLNYLQATGSDDGVCIVTCWFHLCQWYKDSPLSSENSVYHLSRMRLKSVLRDSGITSSLPRDWAKKICLALGQNSSFSRGFEKILYLLLASLRENSPILRAKALRAVSNIVEIDPEALCDKRIQCAVEGRFSDSAISVREAALELVGRHIASHPDVGLKYFEKVAERIKDTGVSVRKRAIKIIRDMCLANSNFSDNTTAFIEVISRVGDEESSIQDLVCKTFFEFWFEEPSGTQTQFASDGSSVPLEVAKKTEQIVNLLRKMPNHHQLITVIKRNLALDFFPQSAKAAGISSAILASVRKRCEMMCKHLLERILQVEEANNIEEVQALPYVLAIQAFCLVDPTLCMPATDPSQFVITLQPYLKHQGDSRLVAQLIESIIFVIDSVLPRLHRPPEAVIDDLYQDLKHMIVRHSFLNVVHACIRCLCTVAKATGRGMDLIEYLIQFFFKILDGSEYDNKQLLGRSLFCLGLLIRYGNNMVVPSHNPDGLIAKSLQLIKRYLVLDDFGSKVRALQALGSVFIARPECMLEMDMRKILGASLSSGTDVRIKMQALQNFLEYLHDVEDQMDQDNANCMRNPHMGNAVPIAAGAGDTNICGGIVQLYWENILESSLDSNDQVRHSVLKIMEIVQRQGLVHPITCVPYLVALETDPNDGNSKLAHQLLMNMNEKYPAFFESRLGDGLQMSFRFYQVIGSNHTQEQASQRGKTCGSAFTFVKPGISRIYRLIRGNRNSRNKFMHSIVRKFEPGGWNYSSVPFLVYCTEILASLPFTWPDEPLYLIYDINRVLQLNAGPIESNMKLWYSSFLQKYSTNHDANQEVDVNPTDHDSIVASKMALDISSVISEDHMQNFQGDCHLAMALQLLLRLKRHLKITYSLNDARCQAFSLKEVPKPGETLSRQHVPLNIADAPTASPKTCKELVDRYQVLKQLLKEDTMDFAVYTFTSAKRKRPTPTPKPLKPKTVAFARGRNGEDDDTDDEDWTGGPRMLNFGTQSIGVRVTRQRAL